MPGDALVIRLNAAVSADRAGPLPALARALLVPGDDTIGVEGVGAGEALAARGPRAVAEDEVLEADCRGGKRGRQRWTLRWWQWSPQTRCKS